MNTFKFPHFSSMNTNFSRSSKFPMSSISIPITTFIQTYSPRFYFIHIYFLSPVEKNVNQIAVNKVKPNIA